MCYVPVTIYIYLKRDRYCCAEVSSKIKLERLKNYVVSILI